jgi:hypothetical protein
MKLNLNYKEDTRWVDMSETHKDSLPIPNLFVSILYQYQDRISNLNEINFAIETGAFDTRTSIFLSEHFDVVFTINFNINGDTEGVNEIDNLTILHSSSEDTIKSILEELPDERFFILLDTNIFLPNTLREELIAIKSSSNRNDHVIMIDDCTNLGQGNTPSYEEFENLLHSINPNYNIINTNEGNQVYLIY